MYDFLQVVNRHHSSKLLSFEKIAFSAFWRQTDGQTDRQTDNAKAVAMIDETSGIDPQRFWCHITKFARRGGTLQWGTGWDLPVQLLLLTYLSLAEYLTLTLIFPRSSTSNPASSTLLVRADFVASLMWIFPAAWHTFNQFVPVTSQDGDPGAGLSGDEI